MSALNASACARTSGAALSAIETILSKHLSATSSGVNPLLDVCLLYTSDAADE